MTEKIFDRFDIGDLIKHTNWGGKKPLITYGVVSEIRTHETPSIPEHKVEITVQYQNNYMSKVHYNQFNTQHLSKLEIIAKAKI